MTDFEKLRQDLPDEIQRVKGLTATLQGLQNMIKLYEDTFDEKYTHGCNIVYEISRINLLRFYKNEPKLI